jgi:DNA-binding HxlR family transcriptional regulator
MTMENTKALLRRIDGKWTIHILAELAQSGRSGLGYCRLRAAINAGPQEAAISTQQLSKALKTLANRDLIACHGEAGEYLLTDRGQALVALLLAVDAAYARVSADSAERKEQADHARSWFGEGLDGFGLAAA